MLFVVFRYLLFDVRGRSLFVGRRLVFVAVRRLLFAVCFVFCVVFAASSLCLLFVARCMSFAVRYLMVAAVGCLLCCVVCYVLCVGWCGVACVA